MLESRFEPVKVNTVKTNCGLYPTSVVLLPLNSKQRIPSDSIVLPVNNFGANYLQLSVCSKGVSAAKLIHFGQVLVCYGSDRSSIARSKGTYNIQTRLIP